MEPGALGYVGTPQVKWSPQLEPPLAQRKDPNRGGAGGAQGQQAQEVWVPYRGPGVGAGSRL